MTLKSVPTINLRQMPEGHRWGRFFSFPLSFPVPEGTATPHYGIIPILPLKIKLVF